MALYRLEAKIIGRTAKDKTGKPLPGKQVSIVAKAAYRSGERLKDERTDKTFNYTSRSQEVLHSEIIAPANAPAWLSGSDEKHGGGLRLQRQKLWNEVELVERRKDSQLAREFIIALPVELDKEQQIEAIRTWCKAEISDKGFVADFALHRSHDGENPHAHILATLRPFEGDGFGKKPDTAGKFNGRGSVGQGAKSDLDVWRASWENHCNTALEAAQVTERVDRRSLSDRGIDRAPEPKIGVDATAMQRRGKVADPDRVRWARWTRMDNQVRSAVSTIKRYGEVMQQGAGGQWWERAQVAIGRVADHARYVLQDETSGGMSAANWQSMIAERNQPQERKQPEKSMEIG